jgi:hypothetical protein
MQKLTDTIKLLNETIFHLKSNLEICYCKETEKKQELKEIQQKINKIEEIISQHKSAIQIIKRSNNEQDN